MKQIIIILLILLSINVSAQKVQMDKDGNYYAVKTTLNKDSLKTTGKTYKDTKGITFPVYLTSSNKLFIVKTSKTGNIYKSYLKL